MELTILGNNGPFPSKNGATSGYLLSLDNKNFVFDFGSGVLSNLQNHIDIDKINAIFISHLHFDHISDLGVLAYYIQVNKLPKIKLFVPEINDYLKTIINTNYFDVVIYGDAPILVDDITFNILKMNHPILTYSFSVTHNGKTFAYTGDTNFCQEVELLFKMADVVLCDTAFIHNTWTEKLPHLSINLACKLAQENNAKVILSHFSPKLTLNEIQNDAFGDYIIATINAKINI